MAARYPRFIILVNGQQAGMALNHDEAWLRALALWQPGCVVGCEPTEVSEGEADEQESEAAEAGQAI